MRILTAILVFALTGLITAAAAIDTQSPPQPLLQNITAQVETSELRMTIDALVGFGTRHTLSDTHSPTHGIGAAREWVKRRFADFTQHCGGCLDIEAPAQLFTG